MAAHDPKVRTVSAKIAADTRWAFEPDRTAATAPAREGFRRKFERLVDPDGTLDPAERAKRAENLRRAYYQTMALKRENARKARKASA